MHVNAWSKRLRVMQVLLSESPPLLYELLDVGVAADRDACVEVCLQSSRALVSKFSSMSLRIALPR